MTKHKLKTHWGKRGFPLCDTEHAVFFTDYGPEVNCKRCIQIAFERATLPPIRTGSRIFRGYTAEESRNLKYVVDVKRCDIPILEEFAAGKQTLWEKLKERMKSGNVDSASVDMILHNYRERFPNIAKYWDTSRRVETITDEGKSDFERMMTEIPEWTDGVPWKGSPTGRYRKDWNPPMHQYRGKLSDYLRQAGVLWMGIDPGVDTNPSYPPWLPALDDGD